MKFKVPKGATPISEDDKERLNLNLTTLEELNEFEANNIAEALIWSARSRTLKKSLLSVSGLKLLHEKMFGKVWGWAGEFRVRQTSIGVSKELIQSDLKILIDDVIYWQKEQTFTIDEIAIRFHHRLVYIHPWVNGNGRFSRLAADLLLTQQNAPSFTWGSNQNLQVEGEVRVQYIKALQKADRNFNDISSLLKFARS